MASYTGMSNLQNHPHRSGFDIGRKNAFTAKVGELLPVYWDISMPGDKYKFNVEYFTRTQPVETSAYTRLREYFDFYAVPLRLLWKSAPSVLTQMQDVNQIQALSLTQNLSLGSYLPSLSLSALSSSLVFLNNGTADPGSTGKPNLFGFNRGDLAYKLLNYLGYGNFVGNVPTAGARWWSTSLQYQATSLYSQQYIQNNVVNIFPILTYQKIYQDFFRWSQWEKANPSSYNVDYFTGVQPTLVNSLPESSSDYWKSDTMFDLRYCNWNKDMLMGVLPNSQFGDVAVIDLPSSVSNVQVADTTGALHPVGTATVMNKGIATSPIGVDLSSGGVINANYNLMEEFKLSFNIMLDSMTDEEIAAFAKQDNAMNLAEVKETLDNIVVNVNEARARVYSQPMVVGNIISFEGTEYNNKEDLSKYSALDRVINKILEGCK